MNIFFAAPFTDRIEPATQLIEESYRKWLESLIVDLTAMGYSITSAHIREHWGEKLESPRLAIQNDFDSISNCDLIVAYLGNPPSPGVQMELGFAVALKKPVIIIREHNSPVPYLVRGLGKMTDATEICFINRVQLMRRLSSKLKSVAAALDTRNALRNESVTRV